MNGEISFFNDPTPSPWSHLMHVGGDPGQGLVDGSDALREDRRDPPSESIDDPV
jgi:hypothetical protein